MLDQYHDDGGFLSTPGAPVPDLLSTATAVFAMHTINLDTTGLLPACPDFVGRLQQPDGGFGGHRFDSTPDCEYTFYALMTLGCLYHEG
jgi:prenyltransferase beta subunit